MLIYAKNDQIVFECDHCKNQLVVPPAKNKRTFMRNLNRFHKEHDCMCPVRMKIKRQEEKFQAAGESAIQIIEKIQRGVIER
jgi:hypothetical protein